ncbi:hypothetical protein IQ249_04950 [Lusitaniella coriacea LEGE 07157]|uniref:Knr4/Smi1-like domain-containing protein n=1 Tax=Lusitaniella coriacea LEGE 07157 TaxID=945747 RepID=A0A8J7AZ05_9CYAN|nr:hypothetical protein [Lusitaniella coriacea]MBE9115244.1 hypothetical protein [Lusitaniella coriacea LEGE 07157]
MSNLTKALNQIMNWLEEYQPECAASFSPGLSRQKIDRLFAPLNVLIPEEIHELYQWRNGRNIEPFLIYTGPCPSIYRFSPLQKAIQQESIEWINRPPADGGYLNPEYENKLLFPFIGDLDPEICAVVISEKQEQNYPVVLLFEGEDPALFCPSITSMMSICAEAYETGAYYLDEENYGFIETNPDKLLKILKKYNAYIY